MNPFKKDGFDSIIGAGMSIRGDLALSAGSTTIIDGTVTAFEIVEAGQDKPNTKTSLVVNGVVQSDQEKLKVSIHNVTVTGKLLCGILNVDGVLAVKKGATIIADRIQYRNLVMEPGAIVMGLMVHLDQLPQVIQADPETIKTETSVV